MTDCVGLNNFTVNR